MKRTIAAVAATSGPEQVITLNGAAQFSDGRVATKALVAFKELLAFWVDLRLLDRSNKGFRPRADKSPSTREVSQ